MKDGSYEEDKRFEKLYSPPKVASVSSTQVSLATYGMKKERSEREMSRDNDPTKVFLDTLVHLVQVAEQNSYPQSLDEWFTANQARDNASALIDHVFQRLMFLGQRLGKLPALPDVSLFPPEKTKVDVTKKDA